ncbi:putative replicative DNA helicase [Bacillus phage vB_BcgM]|nr:putative replicative DNA helicase [Bacillus phage vB_BcgM]
MTNYNYYSQNGLRGELHVITENKLIYKVESYRQLESSEIGFLYNLELVAGREYINPDYSDAQGYVSKEAFVENIQLEQITFYPTSETLTEALDDNGYTVININDYKIHQFKGC